MVSNQTITAAFNAFYSLNWLILLQSLVKLYLWSHATPTLLDLRFRTCDGKLWNRWRHNAFLRNRGDVRERSKPTRIRSWHILLSSLSTAPRQLREMESYLLGREVLVTLNFLIEYFHTEKLQFLQIPRSWKFGLKMQNLRPNTLMPMLCSLKHGCCCLDFLMLSQMSRKFNILMMQLLFLLKLVSVSEFEVKA